MKIIFQILIILLFFGCTNVNTVHKYQPLVNLIVPKDKYSIILKHNFDKNFKSYNKNLTKINVKMNLSFNIGNALSNNGSNNLTIVNGRVDFQILNALNTEKIKSGSISSSINTGSVSSLYGIDENNNFAKERLSKYLASKLYRKILLHINQSEN